MIPLLLLAIALDLLSLSLALYLFFHYRAGKKNPRESYREGYCVLYATRAHDPANNSEDVSKVDCMASDQNPLKKGELYR